LFVRVHTVILRRRLEGGYTSLTCVVRGMPWQRALLGEFRVLPVQLPSRPSRKRMILSVGIAAFPVIIFALLLYFARRAAEMFAMQGRNLNRVCLLDR